MSCGTGNELPYYKQSTFNVSLINERQGIVSVLQTIYL